ncbi:sugar phosphate isomerase/epimerase [Bartonella sp. W8125]|uniref:sugar phosphate isomerase/epimerase family protein n=1 Tax=Bartonella TaxID=773 RepID=UPI0018DDC92E|nr:sugar phosphate isomerase/epimerase family protein [Bartonella choladocola]MBI0141150.1 sugar phosphate isomerase/epimerase [Bartonella choladocola]
MTNRREFILGGVGAMSVTGLDSPTMVAQPKDIADDPSRHGLEKPDKNKHKIYMGSWCFASGLKRPATLDQVIKILSAYGFDGIGVGAGFVNHASIERYPDTHSRKELAKYINGHDLEVALYAPDPYGLPWATDDDAYKSYLKSFKDSLLFTKDIGSPSMRVDPGSFGPLPRNSDYSRIWTRVVETFQKQAKMAADEGVMLLWEPETAQIFVRPSEIIRLLKEVDSKNFKLNVDFAHARAISELGHNQLRPYETLKGGVIEFINMVGAYIGDIGVVDTDDNIVSNIFASHIGLGKGNLNIEQMLQAVIATGYKGPWWGLDIIPVNEVVFTDAWNGIAAYRDMLDRLL